MNKTLTHKQSLFVKHYLANGGNGTQAARDAGYKGNDNTLRVVAAENLAKPNIADAIAVQTQSIQEELQITAQDKRAALWAIVNDGMQEKKHEGIPLGVMADSRAAINAIAELNKMDGDHAAKKVQQETDFNIVVDEIDAGLFGLDDSNAH